MTASNPPEDPGNGQNLDKVQTQRARWATRKMTVKSSKTKRLSLLNRHKRVASEKLAVPGDHQPDDNDNDEDGHTQDGEHRSDAGSDDDQASRTLFFNQPLPADFLDEDGNPLYTFPRNKIRTAKYTPLSFVPKNLWFQFHNVANIFFLFLVILVVSFINCTVNFY